MRGDRDERGGAKAPSRSSHGPVSPLPGAPAPVPGAPVPEPPVPSARARAWLTRIESWGAAGVHAAALGLIVLTALADSATPDLGLLPLYAVPVALVAWALGRTPALTWAALAIVAAVAVQLATGDPSPAVLAWNAAASLTLLAAIGLALSALRISTDFARTVSGTDHLTGILDSLSFRELVELERSRALRYNRPFTLAYLDVDRLRRVNELRGHVTGDRTLQLIASVIRDNIRSMDSVARLGGDEFGLLFPETGKGSAEVALAKVRSCLADAIRTRELAITFSVGVVICVGAPESVDRLIQRADALMYRVKDRGGDGLALEVLDDPFGIEAILQRS